MLRKISKHMLALVVREYYESVVSIQCLVEGMGARSWLPPLWGKVARRAGWGVAAITDDRWPLATDDGPSTKDNSAQLLPVFF
jgi:hypothetical protein